MYVILYDIYLLYRDIGIFATTVYRMVQAQSGHYYRSHGADTTTALAVITITTCMVHLTPFTWWKILHKLIDELALQQLQLASTSDNSYGTRTGNASDNL